MKGRWESMTGAAIVVVASLGCGIGPAPNFKIANHGLSDSCAKLLDYCIEMTCAIENTGDAAGVAKVEFTLYQPDGSAIRRTQLVEVPAGGISAAKEEFKEAKLLDGADAKYECKVLR